MYDLESPLNYEQFYILYMDIKPYTHVYYRHIHHTYSNYINSIVVFELSCTRMKRMLNDRQAEMKKWIKEKAEEEEWYWTYLISFLTFVICLKSLFAKYYYRFCCCCYSYLVYVLLIASMWRIPFRIYFFPFISFFFL